MRLLGLLLGVGLALGLTLFVMDKVDSQSQATAKAAGVTVLPGGIVVPASGGATASGGDAVDAARTVACATMSQALAPPGHLPVVERSLRGPRDLVSSGTIRSPSQSLYTITSTVGFATFRLRTSVLTVAPDL